MADPRFFDCLGPHRLSAVAKAASAQFDGDGTVMISDLAAIENAGPGTVTFYEHRRHRKSLEKTKCAAVLLREDDADLVPEGVAKLIVTDPYRSYAAVAGIFYRERLSALSISPSAHIDPTAKLGENVAVGPGAVIEAGAEIGARTTIGSNAVIGRNCVIGPDCVIHPTATIAYSLIGQKTIVHAGARIGQDGFGYALGVTHAKVPQFGRVLIGDEVEIGANTTIDRGSGPDTVIGSGTKIDNLVQIAHNVVVGEHCVIVALSGLSGSAELGHHVIVAAQSGITGHLKVGDGARLAARTAVIQDLAGNADYGGAPALPAKDWRRQMVAFRRLGRRS